MLGRQPPVGPAQARAPQLGGRARAHTAEPVGRAPERGVVDDSKRAVGGEVDVELDEVGAEGQRLAEAAQAGLGPEACAAPRRGEPRHWSPWGAPTWPPPPPHARTPPRRALGGPRPPPPRPPTPPRFTRPPP